MLKKIALYVKPLLMATIFFSLISCAGNSKEVETTLPSFIVDISQIPEDTTLATAVNLKLDNGYYYLNGKPLSGYITDYYKNHRLKMIGSYLNGMQHGITTTYYENGKLRDSRSYKENKSFGKHIGYWENGNQKFEFYYADDKRQGPNKQWYLSGQPYAFLHFNDDKEDGLQKAWRENGKPYINYEAKDGFRYGLQKSNLCYTLKDEKFKLTE